MDQERFVTLVFCAQDSWQHTLLRPGVWGERPPIVTAWDHGDNGGVQWYSEGHRLFGRGPRALLLAKDGQVSAMGMFHLSHILAGACGLDGFGGVLFERGMWSETAHGWVLSDSQTNHPTLPEDPHRLRGDNTDTWFTGMELRSWRSNTLFASAEYCEGGYVWVPQLAQLPTDLGRKTTVAYALTLCAEATDLGRVVCPELGHPLRWAPAYRPLEPSDVGWVQEHISNRYHRSSDPAGMGTFCGVAIAGSPVVMRGRGDPPADLQCKSCEAVFRRIAERGE